MTRRLTRRLSRRHARRQRGAAILEMVLVTPVLLTLLFGIGEFGLAWVSGNRLEGAVSVAARVGSSQGSTPDADRAILMQLRASLPEDLLENVERVVVFRSNTNGDMPDACRTVTPGTGVGGTGASTPDASGTGATRCNTYSGATVQSITATTNLGSSQTHWRPSARRDTLSGPPDYIGVMVITRHDDFSGTFWRDGFVLERTSIYRIQPDIEIS